jgi:transglutaminase-like putative cysteine protease
MTHAIKAEFRYGARYEEGTQSTAETLALGSGTSRDFAVLMMEALRGFGIATRFVTGYLYDDQSGTTRGGERAGSSMTRPTGSSPDPTRARRGRSLGGAIAADLGWFRRQCR